MSVSSDHALVFLATATADDRERLRSELEAAGMRPVLVESVDEARTAWAILQPDGAPHELAQMTVHNLKTPLTSLLAALEMLAEGDLGSVNERQAAVLRDTQARAHELLALIDDLLELWKLESTVLPLVPEFIDPSELLGDVHREWEPVFRRAGARLLLDEISSPPFSADRAVLGRVLGNLTHNALLHGGPGVTVTLGARVDGDDVILTVRDNGRGIPSRYHHLLFTRFPRLPRTVARTRGTGLGLAYCKLAMTSHGGAIALDSEEGHGCTFTLRLPRAGAGVEVAST